MTDPNFPADVPGGHPTDPGAFSPVGTGPGMPPAQPGFLTAAQLASMQAMVLRSLPWFCTVLANTQSRDAQSDEADDWSPIAIVNCDVEFADPQEENSVGGQIRAVGGYLITLPVGSLVKPQNRLQVNGVTYEIRNRADVWTDETAVFVTAERVE